MGMNRKVQVRKIYLNKNQRHHSSKVEIVTNIKLFFLFSDYDSYDVSTIDFCLYYLLLLCLIV